MTVSLPEYPKFEISDSYNIPSSLHQLIKKIWQNHYGELYENEYHQTESLETACLEILNFFNNNESKLSHFRYLLMAITFAEAIRPTIDAYLDNDPRIEVIFEEVNRFLLNKQKPNLDLINQLFPVTSEGYQALDEALDVLRNLLRVLDPYQAKEGLLEILDDCLEGYAIFPGSQGRRDLFNWWLLEVIPASWCLELSEIIYTIKGLQKMRNIKDRSLYCTEFAIAL